MIVGWLGLGRIGLPLAVGYARAALWVDAYDPLYPGDLALAGHPAFVYETGLSDAYRTARARLALRCSIPDLLGRGASVLFLALPTPSWELDTGALARALGEVAAAGWHGPIVVVSTVTPGACAALSEIVPGRRLYHLSSYAGMGTVLQEEAATARVLGSPDGEVCEALDAVMTARYGAGWRHATRIVSRETSELAKLVVNVVVSLKVGLSNAVMQVAASIPGANAEDVLAICAADRRVASGRYLGYGMADGGGCHPREVAALEHLSEGHAIFSAARQERERHNGWIASQLLMLQRGVPRRIVIWGRDFKDGVPIEDNSSAVEVERLLRLMLHRSHPGVTAFPAHMGGFAVAGQHLDAGPVVLLLATSCGPVEGLIERLKPGSAVLDLSRFGVPVRRDGILYARPGVMP